MKLDELEIVFNYEKMKIQSKTKELIVSFSDEMYLIKQVKDTNIRESTGFAFQQDLYLWPEEAWYLVNR